MRTKLSRLLLSAALLAGGLASSQAAERVTSESLGKRIGEFQLQDFRGKEHSLADYDQSKVIVLAFLGTECPLARLYGPRLQELADTYAARGVTVLGIMSNSQDAVTEISAYARQYGVKFPLLKDLNNKLADEIGARRTPEVFVLDDKRVVRYSGRIDDQYGLAIGSGYAQPKIKEKFLAAALDEVLAGKPVTLAATESTGCLIGRVREVNASSEVTYSNQIARILQKNCVECHRSGQIAPFALTDYSEVSGWADMIAEVVNDGRMPPWHADPKYGHWKNDRSMSAEDKELINTWVRNGAPEGDRSQLPSPIDYPEGWQEGEPDQVVYMSDKPYKVQAEGTIEYQYFMIDPGWTEDHWIKSSECFMQNRAVVHHMFVFAVPPGVEIPDLQDPAAAEGRRERRGGEGGFNPGAGGTELIAGAAPGTPSWTYPEGMGTFLKAGTRLVFQMHYTACGREVEDRSAVGFRWAKASEVQHDVNMNMAINFGFKIPPGADNHPVDAGHTFKQDTLLLTFAPHMHLRGKAFRYDLRYPDGRVETLLDVPRYDFNWQVIYMLDKPLLAPAGSKLECYAHFDNSENNLANPDPTETVTWGDQTWEEMMIGWFSQSTDVDPSMLEGLPTRTARFVKEVEAKPLRVSGLLKKAAASANVSDEECKKFWQRLIREVPQVDRVCITTVDGDKVRVLAAAQPPVFEYPLGTSGATFDAAGSALAAAAAAKEPTTLDVTTATAPDLKTFAPTLASCLSVPVVIDGRPATVNFWSKESGAFPPQAVGVIVELAKLVGTGK